MFTDTLHGLRSPGVCAVQIYDKFLASVHEHLCARVYNIPDNLNNGPAVTASVSLGVLFLMKPSPAISLLSSYSPMTPPPYLSLSHSLYCSFSFPCNLPRNYHRTRPLYRSTHRNNFICSTYPLYNSP